MEAALRQCPILSVLVLVAVLHQCQGHETKCSMFDYEEKVLSKLVRLEHAMELVSERVKKAENTFKRRQAALEREKEDMIKDLEALKTSLRQEQASPTAKHPTALEEEKEDIIKDLTALKETLQQEQTTQKDRIDRQLQDQMAKFTRMSMELETLANETIADMKAQTIRPSVLFSASTASTSKVRNGNAIIYTDVLVNTGNGYDPSTGVFTAPLEGVYIFSAQICTNSGNKVYVQIEVDDTVLTAAGHGDKNYASVCATITAFARVHTGARVMVKCANYCTPLDLAEYPFSKNAFTGLLIHY